MEYTPLPEHRLEQSPCYAIITKKQNYFYCILHPESFIPIIRTPRFKARSITLHTLDANAQPNPENILEL